MPSPHYGRVRDQVGSKRRHLLPEMPAPAQPAPQAPRPWAEPGLTIEERDLRVLAELDGYYGGDGGADPSDMLEEALRATRADALEEAARLVEGEVERSTPPYLAGEIRALKAKP